MPGLAVGYYPSTFHNGESTKLTLLPSRRVLNRADVADWALVAPRAENGTVSKISNQIIFSQCVVGFCGSCAKLLSYSSTGSLLPPTALASMGHEDQEKGGW